VSLHRVDPRFVLPHRVTHAVVLDGLDAWRNGLTSAGIEVSDQPRDDKPPDLVVSPARLARQARHLGARSIIVEGSRERLFDGTDYGVRRLLLRPTRERPTLALPLDQAAPVSYALERWSIVDRRWKTARRHMAQALVSRGLFPPWASPLVTVASRTDGPPAVVAAASELGVPGDARWFLTFGQGDALSRNAFQLFRADSEVPHWVLKFARLAGYSERFDNDAHGLESASAAGEAIAAHVPKLVGRFELDGICASLETAAVGRRLRDILSTPGARAGKLEVIERIAGWILELGRLTRSSPDAMSGERSRLRTEVLPAWIEHGVSSVLVDEIPPIAAVTQHNDLGTWNVVAEGSHFVVVDWENLREAAMPLWDLLYFLGDALVQLDGPGVSDELPARIVRLFAGEAPSSPILFSWVRRAAASAAVPADAVGPIATLSWLSHSDSITTHNLDLTALTPHQPRSHGIEDVARAWLTHPALGPRWSVWRD
jgi:hypothetical protein